MSCCHSCTPFVCKIFVSLTFDRPTFYSDRMFGSESVGVITVQLVSSLLDRLLTLHRTERAE